MTKKKRRFHAPNILTRHYSFIGVATAALFAILSFTPSLLPRSWVMQAVLTGISAVFGYGIGNAISSLYRLLGLPEPPAKNKQPFKKALPYVAAAGVLFFGWRNIEWNNTLHGLVGQEETTSFHLFLILIVATIVALIFLIISRAVRTFVSWVIRQSDRVMPRQTANLVGLILGVVILVFLLNGFIGQVVMSGVNQAFSLRDGSTDAGAEQPMVIEKSGSPDSLVSWESLGRQGRKFTSLGPSAEDINEFSGGGAKEPVRVYVGLKSADTLEERAQLALDELKRTGAFERDVMVVATTTGTGWLDPGAVDTIEYIHNGDTAIVGLQYSYLPSWISLFVDQQITIDTAHATLQNVHEYWSTLPENNRPELYLFGLSLGAFGSQESAADLRLLNDPIDGALWAGPPFMSDAWSRLTHGRDEGSPAWQPIIDNGRVVRFTGEENALSEPSSEWGNLKIAYLQHATDPIVFFSPGLLINSPDWLIEGERGPDISPDVNWFPFLTFWQVAADLPMAGAVPNGHGHAYSPDSYIDVWSAITKPDGWSEKNTESLKTFLSQ
jgi:uncharacterized membrane protein